MARYMYDVESYVEPAVEPVFAIRRIPSASLAIASEGLVSYFRTLESYRDRVATATLPVQKPSCAALLYAHLIRDAQ